MTRRLSAILLFAACGGASPADDAAVRDAGPEPDGAVGIVCRLAHCTVDELCCDEIITPPRPSGFCLPADLPEGCGGRLYACDGPEDCRTDAGPGTCCAVGDDATCQPPGSCAGFVVCHDNDDCPGGGVCGRLSGRVVETCG